MTFASKGFGLQAEDERARGPRHIQIIFRQNMRRPTLTTHTNIQTTVFGHEALSQ